MENMKKAVVLLSGGLDSATALGIALSEGYSAVALTIDYGQLHKREIESAQAIARHYEVEQFTIKCAMPWGGSALLDPNIPLPSTRSEKEIKNEIPASYVPARNTVFLSLAASCAEAQSAEAIFIGANASDYSGYPDCRPEYMEAFQKLIQLGTKCGTEGRAFEIKAPLIKLKKSEIIELGNLLRVPYELTWSCYRGARLPCGNCDSCILRAMGFQEAGAEDPIFYRGQSLKFGTIPLNT